MSIRDERNIGLPNCSVELPPAEVVDEPGYHPGKHQLASSLESEQALIAAAITSVEAYDQVAQVLSADDFTNGLMRCLWDALTAMREADRPVDVITLATVLRASERWSGISATDPVIYIDALTESAATFVSIDRYIQIVHNASTCRRLLKYSADVNEVAHNGELDADQKLSEAFAKLAPLTQTVPDGFTGYQEPVKEAVQQIIKAAEAGDGITGLSTGFSAIDDITAGLQDADLIILAARPSMGKTVLAMNIANHVAREHPVLVFSLEMPKAELAKRSLSSIAGANFGDLKKGRIQDVDKLKDAQRQMNAMNMRIDDTPDLSVDQLRTRARIAARKEAPRLIVIDYLTLLTGKGESETLRVGYIAKSLKAMAREFNCPVLVLAQLNRGVESRPDKRPLLSDLRDSGEIEQAADVVMFNYLDERYDEDSPRRGYLELLIRKHRNGEIGTRYLEWEGHYQRFRNLGSPVPPLQTKKKSSKPLADVLKGNSNVVQMEDF